MQRFEKEKVTLRKLFLIASSIVAMTISSGAIADDDDEDFIESYKVKAPGVGDLTLEVDHYGEPVTAPVYISVKVQCDKKGAQYWQARDLNFCGYSSHFYDVSKKSLVLTVSLPADRTVSVDDIKENAKSTCAKPMKHVVEMTNACTDPKMLVGREPASARPSRRNKKSK